MIDTVEIVKYPEINPESSRVVRTGKALYGFNYSQGFLFGGGVMSRVVDLTGQRFGRLVVLERSFPNTKGGAARWKCKCDCGKIKVYVGSNLRIGDTKSCGCYQKECFIKRSIIYGHCGGGVSIHGESGSSGSRTREYSAWLNMTKRCRDSSRSSYKHYGGRGIKVYDRWLYSYESFLEDMGRCPEGLTLERIENDGNYEPRNCKWVTQKEQSRNTRCNVWVEFEGERMIKIEWLERIGIDDSSWRYWRDKGLTNTETLQYFMTKEANA